MERLSIVGGDEVTGELVPRVLRITAPAAPEPGAGESFTGGDTRPLTDRLDDYERNLIEGALHAASTNIAEAARLLKTDRGNLYRRMRRLGIRGGGE